MALDVPDDLDCPEIWLPVNKAPFGSATQRWEMATVLPRGHFKIGGPVVTANELLAYLLATELRLPVPRTYYYDCTEASQVTTGALSVEEIEHWGPWREFQDLPFFDGSDFVGSCRKLLADVQVFREMFAFDLWIRNTDRHLDNIRVNELVPEENYSISLIDYSHAFLGNKAEKAQEFRTELDQPGSHSSVIRTEERELFSKLVTHPSQLGDIVGSVRHLTDNDIGEAVDKVAGKVTGLPNKFAVDVLEGLSARRDRLSDRIHDWCTEVGIA